MGSPLGPCRLIGTHVRLEPIDHAHAEGLLKAARGLDWALMPSTLVTPDSVRNFISEALALQSKGEAYAFTVLSNPNGQILGSTRYLDVRELHRGVEIGWTWYSNAVWGTAVNPECKLLLLKHAIEDWKAVRVQLKTDDRNLHSQRAILKLGAKFEGALRNHMVRQDGTLRHSMMYSITSEDWPSVKEGLLTRIADPGLEGRLGAADA